MAKVKSHRGEPVNEYADVTANKGRQASDDSAQWNEASGRMVFTVKKGNGVRHSTWRAGVKKAIKEKAGAGGGRASLDPRLGLRGSPSSRGAFVDPRHFWRQPWIPGEFRDRSGSRIPIGTLLWIPVVLRGKPGSWLTWSKRDQ